MFGIGSTELLVILLVALVVLGPKSLPKMARTLGKAMGEFRRVSTDFQRTLNTEVDLEEHNERKKAAEREYFPSENSPDEGRATASKSESQAQSVSTASAGTSSTGTASSTTENPEAKPSA